MKESLPLIYLSGIVALLSITAIFVLLQIIKSRRVESRFSRLQKKLQEQKGNAREYYELGSLYLDKKLFVQSTSLLQKALKTGEKIEPENKALIYNALGYSHFVQEQYDLAIRNYKEAIKLYPDYTIAINNLGNVYERKKMEPQALEAYEATLEYDPNNKIAKRRSESLRKRLVDSK